jgi:hypothetical protein
VAVLRHVLAHNGPVEQEIVAHAASLLRPGGCAYLADIDVTVIRTWPEDPIWTESWQRYAEFHAGRGNDLRVGLRLNLLLAGAGLDLVTYGGVVMVLPEPPVGFWGPPWAAREAMVAAGVMTEADVARWAAASTARDESGAIPARFVPVFVAVGRRPE